MDVVQKVGLAIVSIGLAVELFLALRSLHRRNYKEAILPGVFALCMAAAGVIILLKS